MIQKYKDIFLDFIADMKSNIRIKHRSLRLGIKNLIVWFPIIWNDRQWDSSYIIILFQHKLKQMEEFYRSDECHNSDWEKVADEIREVRKCLDMIHNNEYYNEKMWGLLSNREYNFGNKQTEEDQKEFETTKFFMTAEEVISKKNQNKAFDLIKKNIDNWWD